MGHKSRAVPVTVTVQQSPGCHRHKDATLPRTVPFPASSFGLSGCRPNPMRGQNSTGKLLRAVPRAPARGRSARRAAAGAQFPGGAEARPGAVGLQTGLYSRRLGGNTVRERAVQWPGHLWVTWELSEEAPAHRRDRGTL